MATRTFGPIQGAGTQVNEREGGAPIQPASKGWAGYIGVLERGPVNELITVFDKADLERKTGKRFSGSLLPKVCRDYFDQAKGAGGLHLVRVTDGNERAASLTLYARRSTRAAVGTVSAKDGGRWGGKEARYSGVLASGASLTDTAMTTGVSTWTLDELVGGYIVLDAVANRRYRITGNSAAGVVSVAADQTMADDLAASAAPTNYRWYIELDNESKEVSIQIDHGEENPTTEFSLLVFCDGDLVRSYPNLSMDTASGRYWVSVINDDPANYWITVTDTYTGTRDATSRPANHYRVVPAGGITATTIFATIHEFEVLNSPSNGNPTMTLGTTTDSMVEQDITITMTSATAGTASSSRYGALGSITLGTLFTPTNRYVPPFTVTAGGTALASGDTLRIRYKPMKASELIGGYVYADAVNFPRTRFRIIANTHRIITVAEGSDMTTVTTVGDQFMVTAARRLENGRDGISTLVDADYVQAWDQDTSLMRRAFGRNFGLIKMATPGVTSTLVQQAGRVFADRWNHQYRYEIPANVTDEIAADTLVSDTLGRSDYAVVSLPSFVTMPDPDSRDGRRVVQSATGLIHGREARIAADFDGYHKAEAGVDAVLEGVLATPIGSRLLNEEFLNPRGIGVIKRKGGSFVLWGNRTLFRSSEWAFKAQRETMSYYEQVLQESFDWIIFSLNDANGRAQVSATLNDFFQREYKKRALDNDYKFDQACVIKIDAENNTAATRAAGDMICEITLAITNCVERLKISIGKKGIFTATV